MPYLSSECKLLDTKLCKFMRVMMMGSAHTYDEHADKHTCKTNEQVFKYWRVAPCALEFRIRRLRMFQGFIRKPSEHVQVNAPMFGKLIFEPDQLIDAGHPCTHAHPWLHMFAKDLEALEVIDEGATLHEYMSDRSGIHTLLHDPEAKDMFVPVFIEDVASVGELAHRTSLITGDSYGMSVLLDGGMGELVRPTVVPEVNDLAALAL